MIYYFTGTGNDLYIAKQLGEALNEPICSIPQIMPETFRFQDGVSMTSDFAPVQCDDEVIGIVFPTYAHDAPPFIKTFLTNATLQPKYGFLVTTYGNIDGGAAKWAAEFAQSVGFPVTYSNGINMADNWLPSYDAAVQQSMDKNVEGQLESIIQDLRARRTYIRPATEDDYAIHERHLDEGPFAKPTAHETFVVDDRCIGCGTCQRVCPCATVTLEEGQPHYANQECAWCFACINLCPTKAIGFRTLPDANREARYHNPHVSVADIIAANEQARS